MRLGQCDLEEFGLDGVRRLRGLLVDRDRIGGPVDPDPARGHAVWPSMVLRHCPFSTSDNDGKSTVRSVRNRSTNSAASRCRSPDDAGRLNAGGPNLGFALDGGIGGVDALARRSVSLHGCTHGLGVDTVLEVEAPCFGDPRVPSAPTLADRGEPTRLHRRAVFRIRTDSSPLRSSPPPMSLRTLGCRSFNGLVLNIFHAEPGSRSAERLTIRESLTAT
jgi:hypothetical protein